MVRKYLKYQPLNSRQKSTARKGTTLVEMAVVSGILLMFLFGILEYGRLLFMQQIIDNAAREGARFASVNTQLDDLDAQTTAVVRKRLLGFDKVVKNTTIQVYRSDINGKNVGAASDTPFGEFITVEISGNYSPVVAGFLGLPNTLVLRAKCFMNSEAN